MQKKIIIGALGGVILLGLFLGINRYKKSGIDKEIRRYENRVEKYPEDPENYKTLSKLYEKLKDYENSEKYYALAKQAEILNEETDQQKRLAELQKLIGFSRAISQSKKKKGKGEEEIEDSDTIKTSFDLKKLDKTDDPILNKAINAYNKAKEHYQKKELEQAIKKLKEAISHKEDFDKAYSFLGSIQLEKKNFQKALENSKKAVSLNPKDDNAFFVKGEVFREYKDSQQARKNYKQAVENNNQHYLAFYRLGNIKYRMQSYKEASGFYAKCLKIKPDFYKAIINLGMCYYQSNNLISSRKLFERAINTNAIKKDKSSLYFAYSRLGFINKKLRSYDKAILYLKKASEIKENPKHLVLLGIIYEEKGNKVLAKEVYNNALGVDPENIEALYNFGTLIMNGDDPKEALKYFKKIVEIKPSYIKAHINTGICYVKLNDRDSAKKYFTEAFKINKKHPDVNIELAKYWKEKTIMDKAVYHTKIAIINEKNLSRKAKYFNELGLIYLDFELEDEAIKSFLKSREIEPTNKDTLKSLIKIYTKQKNWEEVSKYTIIFIRIDSKAYEYYENLGKSYLKMKENGKAKKILNDLLNKNPSYKNRKEIEKILQTL